MQPIILLNNEQEVEKDSQYYKFKGKKGSCYWPTQLGKGLGQCGIWNFLWRIGYHPILLPKEKLPDPNPERLLFVDRTDSLDQETENSLRNWMHSGGRVIATGELKSWKAFLPFKNDWKEVFFPHPHAALAYLIDNGPPEIVAPPTWNFIEYHGKNSINHLFTGFIAAIHGEIQTPQRALILPYENAPALIQNEFFYFINGQPFSAFQAWMQGQEDLTPWLSWRHRLFWLDEWVSFFCEMLLKQNILNEKIPRPGIKGLSKTTIILRHDLDFSKDLSFLQEENKRNIAATHAVLKDKNTHFWTKELNKYQKHEIAFHYNTGKRNWLGIMQRMIKQKNVSSYIQSQKNIVGNGLLKQIQWAKKNGIHSKTVHRHLSFLIYPELIDSLDNVFESELRVLGSSSLFRAHVLRWGTDRVDGSNGFLAHWPDAQFPFWFPFKLGHAGKNGKILKGWEMTSVIEVEPDLVRQLLEYKIKHIHQNVFTLNFHPAHATSNSYYPGGSLKHFQSLLDILMSRKVDIMPMKQVLEKVNENF